MRTALFQVAAALSAVVCAVVAAHGETYSLNADWRFMKAPETIPLAQAKASVEKGGAKVEDVGFDDSGWEQVSLPHPINASDSFDDRTVDAGEAAFWRGMAFYRKRFALGREEGRGKAFITFETVRQTIYVWVNGKFAGYYEAGVAPCAFDVTELVKAGENVVCVATDNCAARGTKVITRETVPGNPPGDMSGATYQWNTTDFNEVQGGLVGNVSLVVKPGKVYLTLPYYNNLKTVGTYVAVKDFNFAKGEATICVKAEVRNEDISRRGEMRRRGAASEGRFGEAEPEGCASIREAQRVRVRFEVVDAGIVLTGLTGLAGLKDKPNLVNLVNPVKNISPAADAGRVYLTALEGDVYESAPQPTRLNGPETTMLVAEGRAKGLTFWSPETPHLYDVVVSLVDEKGETLDQETIRTGFREVVFDAAKGGLLVNGKNVWLTGYAQRSTDEWAAIGVAPDWLQDYDAALIRRSNANFVRWMHVAPKPAPVRAFDKFGVVSAAPAGDKEGDVSGRAWAQRVEAMRDVIIYFRNSPSVFFWEAGNNQITPVHMREMVELRKLLDPDGFRFMGCRTLQTKEQIAEAEYVGTMLHRHETQAFDAMTALGRHMPIMETEYARQESPRRCWDDFTPPDFDYRGRWLNGGKKETGFDVYDQTQEDFALLTAKEYAEFWSSRNSGARAKTYTACAALCWTDSNQHGRQAFSENCRSSGRVDAVRIPKMNFDVFRVMQSEDPAVVLVGHWTYPKLTKDGYLYPVKKYNGKFMEETGEKAQRDPLHKTVYAIGSAHCASVELLVNGRSKGVNDKPKDVFVYEFPNVDVTEGGVAEAVARDKSGKEIARHRVMSFAAPGKLAAKVTTGPSGWLADGADIAMVDLSLVDANGTVHPFASEKVSFELSFEPNTQLASTRSTCSTRLNSQLPTHNSPIFMGGWNSGVFGEASPIGKDFVNLECGRARVFLKAGRKAGKAALKWKMAGARVPRDRSGKIELDLKPVEVSHGLMSAAQQAFPANTRTFGRKTGAPYVQDLASVRSSGGEKYKVFVNGVEVEFPKGIGAPVKLDDNTGVSCAYVPVLVALMKAGANLEFSHEPKRIPASKKWLRKVSPTPFVPMVTVRAGGREVDACVGFTELFIDNGKDKNLTNCEIYRAKENSSVVCGEVVSLVGYIPGVEAKTDATKKRVDLEVR